MKFTKLGIFCFFFVMCFTINAGLGTLMTGTAFFYLTTTKLFLRFLIALMLTMLYGDKIIDRYSKR